MYSSSHSHSNRDMAFATPNPKSRSAKAKQTARNTRQENVTENNKDVASNFATPRASYIKPSIVKKEKLATSGLSSLSFGNNRSNDPVPTAHVTPNLLQSTAGSSSPRHRTTSSLHRYPSDDTLYNRHGSSGDRLNNHMSANTEPGLSHRWGSQNMIVGGDRNGGDFRPLQYDANMTLDQAQLYRDNDDLDPYRSNGVTTTHQARYDMGGVSSSQNHATALRNDHGGSINYQYAHPHREPLRTASPVNTDRSSYPYNQTPTATMPTYNAHNYSQEYRCSPVTDSHGNVVQSAPGGDQFSSDLTCWQQKHQEALRRQQLEMNPSFSPMSSGPHNGASSYGSGLSPSVTSLLVGDPHKLDSVRHAADNIIKEKDMIIERQKMKIIDLERLTKETESDIHKDMYRQARDDNDALNVKLQDAWEDDFEPEGSQYENVSLKAQLREHKFNSNKCSNGQLEEKLGATEHELQQIKLMLKEEMETNKTQSSKWVEKIKEKDGLILECQDKYSTLRRSYDNLQKKVEGMNRYFGDLPTADESSKKKKEVRSLREENTDFREQITHLKKKLSDSQKGIKSRDALVEKLEKRVQELQDSIEKLESANAKLREHLSQDGSGIDDVEELQSENKKLRADFETAKKLAEKYQKKLLQEDARHKSSLADVQERLEYEESAVVALRSEILSKDQHLKKLRQSLKEVSCSNQDLVESNISLKDRIQDTERHVGGDVHKIEKRLVTDMSLCFTELNNLVHVCMQRAEGQDPNISALLGVKAARAEEHDLDKNVTDHLQSFMAKITKVREMRDEIEKLRELVSNKYAEDLGENLTGCTTQ